MIKLSPEEMAGRREDSQCFKCPEKWSQAHQKTCPMRGIYLLDVSEDEHPDDDSINSEVEIPPPPTLSLVPAQQRPCGYSSLSRIRLSSP
jgi:hypothetical protein